MKLRAPEKKAVDDHTKRKDEHSLISRDAFVASAYLKSSEVQDFAEQICEISKAAVGYNFKVEVRVEVGEEGKRPLEEVVQAVNAKLAEVSKNLKLEKE